MRPDEPMDEHATIDPNDIGQIASIAERLATTPDELREAVARVGGHPVSVALYLNRADRLKDLRASASGS